MTDQSNQQGPEEAEDITEVSDLVLGFAFHDEGQHWHPSAYLMPDTFTEQQAQELEQLADEFAQRLSKANLTLPPES